MTEREGMDLVKWPVPFQTAGFYEYRFACRENPMCYP